MYNSFMELCAGEPEGEVCGRWKGRLEWITSLEGYKPEWIIFLFVSVFLGGLGAGGPVTRDGRLSWWSGPAADLFTLEVRHRN